MLAKGHIDFQDQVSMKITYDKELLCSVVHIHSGNMELKFLLNTRRLAEMVASAFDAAAADSNSIGFDTWMQMNQRLPMERIMGTATTPRLSHLT